MISYSDYNTGVLCIIEFQEHGGLQVIRVSEQKSHSDKTPISVVYQHLLSKDKNSFLPSRLAE